MGEREKESGSLRRGKSRMKKKFWYCCSQMDTIVVHIVQNLRSVEYGAVLFYKKGDIYTSQPLMK
jgi:hypothetical protein